MHTSTLLEATDLEAIDLDVSGFAALADATRLRILAVLADGSSCVCDLQEHVRVAANVLSYHLKVLREAGLVHATRRGRWIDYTVDVAALERLRRAVPGAAVAVAP